MTVLPEFDVISTVDDREAVVQVRGELDASTAPLLRDTVSALVGDGVRAITVDCSDLEFIDSNGLHALVVSLKRLREHDGELRLRSPRPSTRKVLEIVGLAGVIPIV